MRECVLSIICIKDLKKLFAVEKNMITMTLKFFILSLFINFSYCDNGDVVRAYIRDKPSKITCFSDNPDDFQETIISCRPIERIYVRRVFYGRLSKDSRVCTKKDEPNQILRKSCGTTNVLFLMSHLCNGLRSCRIGHIGGRYIFERSTEYKEIFGLESWKEPERFRMYDYGQCDVNSYANISYSCITGMVIKRCLFLSLYKGNRK